MVELLFRGVFDLSVLLGIGLFVAIAAFVAFVTWQEIWEMARNKAHA